MARKRRQRIVGLVPRLGQWLWTMLVSLVRHPQMFFATLLMGVVVWALWGYVVRTDAFQITRVILPPDSSLKVRESVLHTNLWDLDVEWLADSLKQQQPWLEDIRVIRQLPNAVRIQTIPRTPLARVQLDRWYLVDKTGFVWPPANDQSAEVLVRLTGWDRGGSSLRIGKENTDGRLLLALRVLQRVRRLSPALARRVTEINVADTQQLKFRMDLSSARLVSGSSGAETEVRCGAEAELEMHLGRLRAAMKVMAKQSVAARYIDVRFQEPVIGPPT